MNLAALLVRHFRKNVDVDERDFIVRTEKAIRVLSEKNCKLCFPMVVFERTATDSVSRDRGLRACARTGVEFCERCYEWLTRAAKEIRTETSESRSHCFLCSGLYFWESARKRHLDSAYRDQIIRLNVPMKYWELGRCRSGSHLWIGRDAVSTRILASYSATSCEEILRDSLLSISPPGEYIRQSTPSQFDRSNSQRRAKSKKQNANVTEILKLSNQELATEKAENKNSFDALLKLLGNHPEEVDEAPSSRVRLSAKNEETRKRLATLVFKSLARVLYREGRTHKTKKPTNAIELGMLVSSAWSSLQNETQFTRLVLREYQPSVGGKYLSGVFWFAAEVLSSMGIPLRLKHSPELPACLLFIDARPRIIVHNGLCEWDKAWHMMHELGHSVLNHRSTADYWIFENELTKDRRDEFEDQEAQADLFASWMIELLTVVCTGTSTTAVDREDAFSKVAVAFKAWQVATLNAGFHEANEEVNTSCPHYLSTFYSTVLKLVLRRLENCQDPSIRKSLLDIYQVAVNERNEIGD